MLYQPLHSTHGLTQRFSCWAAVHYPGLSASISLASTSSGHSGPSVRYQDEFRLSVKMVSGWALRTGKQQRVQSCGPQAGETISTDVCAGKIPWRERKRKALDREAAFPVSARREHLCQPHLPYHPPLVVRNIIRSVSGHTRQSRRGPFSFR